MYITPPYSFAEGGTTGQSVTTPLIDPRTPRTNTYVGQILIDFFVTHIFDVLTSSSTPLSSGGFPLLISVETNSADGDTVMGPGFNGSISALPVSEVVLAHDQDCQGDEGCSSRRRRFESIVASMKAGNSSSFEFERTSPNGGAERIFISTAPVSVRFLDYIDASDFARGALVNDHLTYSLGIVETYQGILEPFAAIEDEMNRQINVAIGVLAVVIFLAVAATIGISSFVARSISEPMSCLLELTRLLNRLELDQDPPKIDQTVGSKEIINVSNSMESLYRVVRLANLSFYIGDLEAAYRVLVDALRLFQRMDNKKAIAVASNNLGNTMLAMYCEMKYENVNGKFGLTRQELIVKGTAYFHEAIQLGEKAYDDFFEIEGWSPSCLDFMQHLSNRYFNRGIFLLTVKNDHPRPEEIEDLGFRDLQVARDMDAEIEAQGEESGWGDLSRCEKLFNVRLVRIRGYLLLLEMGLFSEDWEIEEILSSLFEMLSNESKKPSSDLFKEVSYVGRLQQAETELTKYLLIKKDIDSAARIAIRMLMEDGAVELFGVSKSLVIPSHTFVVSFNHYTERIFLEAEAKAIKVLQAYVESSESNLDESSQMLLKGSLEDILEDLSDYYESRRNSALSTRTHQVTSRSLKNIYIDDSVSSKKSLSSAPMGARWSVSDQSGQFVTMEQF